MSNPLEVQRPDWRDVLQRLYDLQNGAPLCKYEAEWDKAMKDAETLLASSVTPQGVEAPWSYDMEAAPEGVYWFAYLQGKRPATTKGFVEIYGGKRHYEDGSGFDIPAYAWAPYDAPAAPSPPVSTLDTEEEG